MITGTFKTEKEFNEKFPSKLYVCPYCKNLSEDKYSCKKCGYRADGFFKTMDKGFIYTIEETGKTEEIFKPVELINEWRSNI